MHCTYFYRAVALIGNAFEAVYKIFILVLHKINISLKVVPDEKVRGSGRKGIALVSWH